ncbi:MAG: sulfite exporter TauE/SafE family protein [Verrucomicrobia bacterium]|nr:sulfite exporter TauE/SafE family protein [Verrucomicrobiota bacterium]
MDIVHLLAFLGVGILAGLIGGLLGLSGGVVTVPALVFLFPVMGIPQSQVTHMAIGTSLAAMVLNGIVSTWSHHRREGVLWPLFLSLLPWIIIGSLFGGIVANFISDVVLENLFGFFIVFLGIYLLLPQKKKRELREFNKHSIFWCGTGVGSVASVLGIGGGVFTVPLLIHFNYPEKKAIGTSAAISLVITTVTALTYLYFGMKTVKTPESLGYIYLPAFVFIGLGAMFLAPVGAKWAHAIDGLLLRRIFAAVLIIIGIVMI